MVKGTFVEKKIDSHALNEKMDLIIYLPENYSPLYKSSLFIIQDGKDYIRFGKLPRIIDELVAQNEIRNTIFAFLPYKNTEDRRRKYHPKGEQNKNYLRFLTHELVPYIEEKFPTFEMAGSRFLMGDSLGASISLQAALKYPFTFRHVVLHSPFINEDMLHLAKKMDPAAFKIFHIIGRNETAVQTTDKQTIDFLTPNQALCKLLTAKKLDYQFHLFSGGHFWKYWQSYLRESLLYMISKQKFNDD